ncbi:hypothetical protein BDV95DRAFT_189124 [Massariosphaeria phaeospora]|uniref:Uncharacterized protein n=1 Tax=Massariosphaeria phaeospora TaxID=100035 RepID=A0A7C8I7P9_9PLEO|nr:hypothetical protein BDV95DRAFT_189124 [Massariosphaeria phaeospora]
MSGPYRFTQDSGRSPLDRPHQNLQPAAQPVSYKTNVNRAKTKKWVEAKKNAYDGDDWGDYDEYDEYGTEQDPPPEPAGYGARQAQGQHGAQPSRSFTDPYRQGPQQPARRNSFETGDEHRAFSSMTPVQETPSQQPWAAQAPPPIQTQPAMRQASGAESESSDTPQHRRDFSPSAMPPPLLTKISPAPFGSSTSSPANTQFPPRKSSIGQVDSPVAISPRNRAPSNPATLPFVRPADIYRRVEEERFRERASMDTSRPSLDSLNSPPGPQERPNAASPSAPQAPSLPQAQGISAFDGGFWPGGPQSQQGPGPDSEGFRSVVDQAFTRVDEQRSVPPTPTSKQSDSGVSRSNTDSTSGISPIMSRVPSSATSALRNRNQPGGDGSTPAIAEEASESNTPVSRPTSNNTMLGGAYQVPRKPSPSHSRNISGSSTTDTGLATPTPGESPARSPAFEVREAVPEPETAVLNSTRSTSPDVMEGGLKGKSPAYATREADIASAMRTNPGQYASELSAAEQQSQDAYLDSHNAQSPTDTSLSRSRSESPSKGRVQELAGKFGDVSASRRGSTQSFNSRSSIQSWEKSPGNSRPSSPTKAVPSQLTSSVNDQRPAAGREVSFRPKLPGQWESYATSVPTSSDHDEQDEQLSSHQSYTPDNVRARSPLDEVDLTPTTAKHPVATTGPAPTLTSDPLAALKAAGSAMGEAIQASVGLGSSSSELTHDQAAKHDRGDVYPHKPWQLDRTESSVSTAPPTPPARDTPSSEDMPPPPHLKEKTPEAFPFYNQRQAPVRPTVLPQLSTAPSADDQESDRLRKEIVASLTPQRTSSTPDVDMDRSSLQPIGPSDANRASSILPREYDSYWADGDQTSHDLGRGEGSGPPQASIEHSLPASTSMASEHLEPAKPSIMTRFSWEDNPTPDGHKHAGSSVPVQDAAQEDPNTPSITQSRENETYGGLPAPYFGPNHSVANAGPDNFHDRSIAERSPTPPPASAKPVTSPQTRAIREASPPSGLHVVNSSLNPEAVDMPPRLSAEASLPPQQSDVSPEEATTSHGHTGQQDGEVTPVAETTHGVSFTQGSLPKSPTSDKDKLLGFRDIVTITSSSERIATYNKTRDQWASTDHGLNDWISSAVTSNPELATHPVSQPRPQVAASSLRHRPTGSLSLFGKHSAPSAQQATTGPYYEQYNSAAAQVPTTPTASGAPPPGSNTSSFGGRSTSHQMQTKGKDLLHTAGLLSGKGMTGAKGLFAKGKSRFKGGDKVDK